MTLRNFLKNYDGSGAITIEGYCEEVEFDYYQNVSKEMLSDNNPNHYKPTCITKVSWWNEVKNKQVVRWNVFPLEKNRVELYIELEEEK